MRKRKLWWSLTLAGALAACGTPRANTPPLAGAGLPAAPGEVDDADIVSDGEVYEAGNTYRLLDANELPIVGVTVDSAAPGAPGTNLADGNLATSWINGGFKNPTAFAVVNLGTQAALGSIAIKTGPSPAGTNYDVQVSNNGTTWTTVAAHLTNTTWNLETKPLPANTSGQFVRILWHNSATAPQPHFAIFELVVNGAAGPGPSPSPMPSPTPTPIPTPSGVPTAPPITGGALQTVAPTTVTADSNYASTTPQLAVDGNLSTQWASGGFRNGTAFLELDYDQPHRFDHLDIKTGALPPGVTYDIETDPAEDGFSPITGPLTNTTWGLESKPVNFVARHLRIVFHNNPGAPVARFQVFEVRAVERVIPDPSFAISPGQHQDLANPTMALDGATNEALVVWIDNQNHGLGGLPTLQAQRVRANGTLDGGVIDLAPGITSHKLGARVVFNSVTSEFLVIWADDRGSTSGDLKLWGQRVGTDGTLHGQPFAISSQPVSTFSADLAYNAASNRYLAAWTSGGTVLGQLIDGSGALVGASFQIPGPGAGSVMDGPTLAASAHNNAFLALWSDNRGGVDLPGHTFGQLFDANGGRLGAELDYHGALDVFFRHIAFNFQANEYLVAGMQSGATTDSLVALRLSETGTPIGSPVTLGGQYQAAVLDSVVYDGHANQYLVGWSALRQGVDNLFGQRVASNGALVGSNVQLTFGTHDQELLGLAFSLAANHFLGVWADNRFGPPSTRFGEPETFDVFGGLF